MRRFGKRANDVIYAMGAAKAKTDGIDPEAYLTTVLRRSADHPVNRIAELLPWNLFPSKPPASEAA
jgi:hypothetical protein